MIAMLSFSFIITIILSFVAYYYIDNSTKDALKETIQPFAAQYAEFLDNMISEYENDFINILTSNSFVQSKDDTDRIEILTNSFTTDKNDFSYGIYDLNAKLTASSGGVCADVITNENIEQAINRKDMVITDIITLDDSIYFGLVYPISNGGEIKNVAAVTINAGLLNNFISDISFGASGYAYVVNSNSQIILHNDSSKAVKKQDVNKLAQNNDLYKDVANFLQNAIETENGSGEYRYEKSNYIVGYAKLNHFNGTMIIASPNDNYTRNTSSAIKNFIMIGTALLVITAISSLIFARNISKPIVATTKRIRELAQGNLTDPVDVWYSKDEVGILSNSLEETIVCLRQYINLITIALTQISEGNLTHRMEGTFKGDFIKIKDTFNEIFESLSATFTSINTSAEEVNSGAIRVSNSAQALSQGSTEQASAIEQLSATLNDVSNQVQQNSDDSKNAYDIVHLNAKAITSCNDDMTKMLEAMQLIDTTSSEIANIIKVIDEISFQTNILALNAAVEAAREGSKGFGVVAEEVRRLASRSAEAAKQTAALIENSTNAVDRGSKIAEQTAHSLNDIVDGTETAQGLVKNITDASSAQAEAIKQINTGVDQISAVVATNTATAIGSASASEELSEQSLILKNMITKFKLSEIKYDVPKKNRYVYYDNNLSNQIDEKLASVQSDNMNKFDYPDEEDEDMTLQSDSKVKIVLDDDDDKY